MKTTQRGFIAPLLLIIIALLVAGGGVYVYLQKSQVNQSMVTQTSTSTYHIADLGVTFALPITLSDLTYKVVKLPGDQAVNSVAFSTKKLEAAGCDTEMAPLGYLTFDKGGEIVGHARGSDLYYIKPDGQCRANASLQNWQELETAIKSVVADDIQTSTAQATDKASNITSDPILGRMCGSGVMGGSAECPTGYTCKYPENHVLGAIDGKCARN